MRIAREPWFRISDPTDVGIIAKAFVSGGVITSHPDLAAAKEISLLRHGLRRLLGPGRLRAVTWDYPAASVKSAMRFSAEELAQLYDEATARREPLVGDEPWSAAVRLEVPVAISNRPKIGGISGLSPDDIYEVMGMGAKEAVSASFGPTRLPTIITFTAAGPRRAFAFEWPFRVASLMPEVDIGWAAETGYAAVMDPDLTMSTDLVLIEALVQPQEIPTGAVITVPNLDTAEVGKRTWLELAHRGAVVVPGIETTNLASWFDELTRALSHDRLFDVAVFEAWDRARRQPGVDVLRPPMLFAWPGAFDRARLSRLVPGTIRTLRSCPEDFYLSIPSRMAGRLKLPRNVSAPRLATQLERLGTGPRRLTFFNEDDAGQILSVVRPQITSPIVAQSTSPPVTIKADTTSERDVSMRQAHISEERHINAWLEDGEPPLQKGRTYRLAINVGALRREALATSKLPDIDWRGKEALKVVIVLGGYGFSVQPRQHELVLPRTGNTEPVFFDITPTRSDSLLLRVSLYLAVELTLLQEFQTTIPIQDVAKAA